MSSGLGVNLDFNAVDGPSPIWTDLHNVAGSWSPASGSTLSLTSDGYPLANAQTWFSLANYPAGNYQFSYTGGGTVSFTNSGQLVGPVTVSNGVTTGTVAFSHAVGDGTYIGMAVTNVNPSNPMDNFHLMMPGYGNGTTPEPMFTPAFLQSLAPFSNIRFMNWGGTNDSKLSDWANRSQPNNFLTAEHSVPYEDMIELCNEAQKDMWINIPAEATPSFVQSLAQLIDSQLDSNLNVYVEYGNEDWNGGFNAYGQIAAAAEANPVLNHALGQFQLVAQQAAYTLVNDGQIFDQAFGSAGTARVRPIYGGQCSWTQYASYGLKFIQQYFGDPSQFIYATAVAPYITIQSSQNKTPLTLDQLFADLDTYFTKDVVPWIQADAALAQQYDLPLIAYEGGQGLTPGHGPNYAVEQQAQYDPRMYQLYVSLMKAWQQAGGGTFDAYQLSGTGNIYGYWGMLDNVTEVGSAKYDGLLAGVLQPGDANGDGSVDYADFQSLAANYGSYDAHWVQGDFNGDNWVNWTDLDMLRQGLDPDGFTLSQFAQQALFGQFGTVNTPTALEYDGYGVTYASSLALTATSGTVTLNRNIAAGPISLGGVAYSEGLGFTGNSSTTIALGGQYARFDSTIGVDSSGSTASSVIFDVYGDGTLLYQSAVMGSGSTPVPIDVNVAGVKNLQLVVAAAPGSSAGKDHAVWGDARLVSTANFAAAQPYTLTWQLSQNGQVLSTQTADSFSFAALSGTYTISLTVIDAQGDTATASTTVTEAAQAATAAFTLKDSATSGNWIGTFGGQGYDIGGDPASLPAYATISFSGASPFTAAASTTDPRALENPGGSGHAATGWYGSSFTINVNTVDSQTHLLSIYALDWARASRVEQVELVDAKTGTVLDTERLSNFGNGAYLQWEISGDVKIVVTDISGVNAVVSGVFLDQVPATPSPLVQRDGATEGNWIGTYGTQGYDIDGAKSSLPSYASVSVVGANTYKVAASTTDPRGLQNPGGSGRSAIGWYGTANGSTFTIDVNLTDGQEHLLSIYAVDWGYSGRVEDVDLVDAATGDVLDTETLSNFGNGAYLQWLVSGDVQIHVMSENACNAVVSGVFIDPATTPLVKSDGVTQGDAIGAYVRSGPDIEGDPASLPSDARVSVGGAGSYTAASSTTDVGTLENPGVGPLGHPMVRHDLHVRRELHRWSAARAADLRHGLLPRRPGRVAVAGQRARKVGGD